MRAHLAEDGKVQQLIAALSAEMRLEAALLVGSRARQSRLAAQVDYDVALLYTPDVSLDEQLECTTELSGRHAFADFLDLRCIFDVNITLHQSEVLFDRGDGRWREVLYRCWKLRDELQKVRHHWIDHPSKLGVALQSLNSATASLRELARRSRGEIEEDPYLSAATLHLLQTAGHQAYDFSSRVAAGRRLGLPLEHGAAFGQLARTGLLCADLADRMQSWLGLRDLIIHHSDRLDWEMVWEVLTHDLPDLEEFLTWAHRLIDKSEKEQPQNEKG